MKSPAAIDDSSGARRQGAMRSYVRLPPPVLEMGSSNAAYMV